MLCSDGLHDLVEDRELEQILVMTSTPYEASERLIALARARGGYDNITIGVVKLRPVNRSATERAPVTRETEAVE
jgi:protein phosphatase